MESSAGSGSSGEIAHATAPRPMASTDSNARTTSNGRLAKRPRMPGAPDSLPVRDVVVVTGDAGTTVCASLQRGHLTCFPTRAGRAFRPVPHAEHLKERDV